MASTWSAARARRELNEWGLALSLLVIGTALLLVSQRYWHTFLEPFSHALLIAGFLALTAEGAIRRRFAAAVAQDVSGALIGYRLPSEVQDDIKRSVTTISLVMADYRQHYAITEIQGDTDHVDVALTIEYDIRNYGPDPDSYKAHMGEEESYGPQFLSLTTGPLVESGAQLEARIKRKDQDVPTGQGSIFVDGPEVTVPGREGDAAPPSIRVRWRMRLTMEADDTALIAFGRPTLGVQVSVEKPADWSFHVSHDEKRIDGVNDWRFPRLFRKNEHLRVRWWRKRP